MFNKTKKTEETKSPVYEIKKSGGEIDDCVFQLIGRAFDKNEQAKLAVSISLNEIGRYQPELVLSSCICYVSKKSSKIEYGHRVQILRIIGNILEERRDKLSNQLSQSIISFATGEMVASHEVKTEWQDPASNILVLLSIPCCNHVIDGLLEHFTHGSIPHYFIIKTLADVAAANGVEFTLRMQDVLGRVIPVLGSIKKSPIKWVFATALGRFAEAINHYNANAPPEALAKVQTSLFATEMVSGWDVLFTKWLISKESKVRFAVAESLGYMSLTLDRSSFEDRIEKIMTQYLAMYKKEKYTEHLPISQGVCAVLVEGVKDGGKSVEPILTIVLQGLHPLVCRTIDYATSTPAVLKNHNVLMRCFEILARELLETTLNFVINRFQLKDSSTRIGSLVILRHFVNSLNDVLEDKKPLIMSSVITLVHETDPNVKKAIMQLIVSMSNNDYLPLEGGQTLVKFICQQCALKDAPAKKGKKKGGGGVTAATLRDAANRMLFVMATRVPSTHVVLWPYLFELLADKKFDRAIVIIARSLHSLGTRKREEGSDDYKVDFKSNINLPSPQFIIARLMISASVPDAEPGMGKAIVQCMGALGPTLNVDIGNYWDESIPQLLNFLQANRADLNIAQWQETLLKMWKQSINAVDDKGWLRELCTALTEMFEVYKSQNEHCRTLFRYLGATLSSLEAKALIGGTLDMILSKIDHKNDAQRQGCAQALGLCGNKHLDMVLPKLTACLGPPKKEKSGGFFSRSSSKKGAGDHVKSTVLLSYGYVAAYANSNLILSRLDVHIMHNLVPILQTAKTPLIKVNVIKSIDLMGKAIHVSRLPDGKKDYVLQKRDDLMNGVMKILEGTKSTSIDSLQLKLLGINAASTLSNLQPPVPEEVREKMFSAILPIYKLFAEEKTSSEENPDDEKEDKQELNVMQMILSNLNVLLESLVHMEPTVASVVDILKRLEPYLNSPNSVERARSATSYLIICKKFVSKIVHDKCPQTVDVIPEFGQMIAVLIPRCTDSSLVVRQTCVENVQALLYIDQLLENAANPKPIQEIRLISDIKGRVNVHYEDRKEAIRDLAALITTVIAIDESFDLLKALPKGLMDPDEEGARGNAEFIHGVIIQKGSELSNEKLVETVHELVSAVKEIDRPEVEKPTLVAFRKLADHDSNFKLLVRTLLKNTVPLADEVIKCFVTLVSGEQGLALNTIKTLFSSLNETPMEKDKPTPLVMTTTCALKAILPIDNVKQLLQASYPALFCSLLMRIGTASGVDEGQSSKDAVETFKVFLESLNEETMLRKLNEEDPWEVMKTNKYDDSVTKATAIFCSVHGDKKRSVVKFVAKFYSGQSAIGQRVVATALLAEFVSHSKDDSALLKELIKFLLPRVADKIDKVRKQALRGLGNLVTVWSEDVSDSAASVLAALTSASEDKEAEVAAEAVASLTRIVSVVDEETIGPMLINICYRMRPAFDRKNASVRSAAFTLFGALCRFGQSYRRNTGATRGVQGLVKNFIEQVHTNVPIFIIHLNDDDETVRTSCLEGFKKVSSLLHDTILAIVDVTTTEPEMYDDFIKKISPPLGELFPEQLRAYVDSSVDYFTSSWETIQGNAAVFSATLVANASEDNRRAVNINSLCKALIKLLNHKEPDVRVRSAKAMSLLYEV